MGNYVDTEVCLASKCPFADKTNGFCLRALALRQKKEDVCVSTVSIKVKKSKKKE
jgi:hypothetical protein